MTLLSLSNFVTVTRKSLGSGVVDVKAIILRSTHPVTVKLTSGERYDTVHPQCNHHSTPLYIIVALYDVLQHTRPPYQRAQHHTLLLSSSQFQLAPGGGGSYRNSYDTECIQVIHCSDFCTYLII